MIIECDIYCEGIFANMSQKSCKCLFYWKILIDVILHIKTLDYNPFFLLSVLKAIEQKFNIMSTQFICFNLSFASFYSISSTMMSKILLNISFVYYQRDIYSL